MKMINRRHFIAGTALAGTSLLPASRRGALADAGMNLDFMLHAAFFSREMKVAKPLDPQMFVFDAAAPAATGPQGIHHVAGYRPALLAGPVDVGAYNADGRKLDFQIAQWFAARGTAEIIPRGDGALVTCHFTNLRPSGMYSLFATHFDLRPIAFTPLDGTGTTNNFGANANGTASITVVAPRHFTHANAIVLVYHSDHQPHGMSRGEIGLTAHHQLIAPIPA